jgi:hypothetical protein
MATGKKINYDIILAATARGMERAMRRGGDAAAQMSKTINRSVRDANRSIGRMITTAGKIGAAFGAAGAAAGVYAFTRTMGEAIRLAGIQEKAEAKLGAVLKATGEAAGYNLEQLKAMAGEMQDLTGVGDEVILNGMAMLATFKNVAGDGFKRATMAALDMSQVLDQDLKTSVIQIGKALNDPILGMTALSKAGVQFTETQKEMAKSMVESGDLMGAQEIILQELSSQFGGAAAANLETFGGRLDAAKGRLSDLKEEIGFAVTKNEFFIEVLKLADQQLKEWTESIKGNRAATMQYAKDGALAMVEFGQSMITVAGLAVSAGNGISGVFRTTAAASLYLSGGIFKAIEGLTALTNKLKLTRADTDAWRINAEAAFAAAGQVFGEAQTDFQQMAEGSEALGAASVQLDRLKTTLEGIDAGEVKDAATATREASQEMVKIGGVWQQVSSAAMDRAAEDVKYAAQAMAGDTEALGTDWGRVWDAMQRGAIDDIDAVDSRLDRLTDKRREVTIYVKEVVQKAVGGLIQGYASGGRLPGYGGGDRIPALLEAGEFIIRKEAVARFGASMFAALNSLQLPKFATGGPVGAAATASGPSLAVDLRISDGPAVRVWTDRQGYDSFMREAARRQRLASS